MSSGEVNLDNCAREPIHVPGSIQPFGVLLAKRAGTAMISQASNNTALIFGVEPDQVLGRDVSDIFGKFSASTIQNALEAGNWKDINPLKLSISRNGSAVPCNVIVHRYDGLDFLEIEEVDVVGADAALRSYQMIQSALLRLQNSLNIPDLWTTVVAEVSRITGYDRVMVYKFDRDDHGYVIAEQKRDHHSPFLGLHYPATDIPDQARRLYRSNWVRYIPDIYYKRVDLIPVVDQQHERLTDMTHCVLRSVSPIHREYLRNMGVAASMSVSIIRDSRLWGLIACHNDTPKHLPYELRSACEVLGQVLSIRIAALEDSEDCAYKSKVNELQARFLAELSKARNVASALVGRAPNLLEFIPSTGAAVCIRGTIQTLGECPEEASIRQILKNLLLRAKSPIFASDRLQDRLMEARDFTDLGSGVLCFTASKAHDFHVLWFRPEQVKVVAWGGDPNKPAVLDGEQLRLSPRKSFEVWKQEVRGQSEPWTQPEIEAAAELRATLMSVLLSRDGDAADAAITV